MSGKHKMRDAQRRSHLSTMPLDRNRNEWRFVVIAVGVAIFVQSAPAFAALGPVGILSSTRDKADGRAELAQSTVPDPGDHVQQLAAVDSYIRHIYSIYLGLRACTEMAKEQKDGSFLPDVPLEEARKTLKSIDAAASEVGVSSDADWTAAAPTGEVTAEAMKADPQKHVDVCHRIGAIFRVDASNLQVLLKRLGAKTIVIQKDF